MKNNNNNNHAYLPCKKVKYITPSMSMRTKVHCVLLGVVLSPVAFAIGGATLGVMGYA